MEMNMFVKYIKLDENKRILVAIQDQFISYLTEADNKKMLKEGAEKILKENFIQLEIGKNIIRLTVKEGTEEESMTLVKEELVKALEMAMAFMSQMNKK
ncbi:hypothetical protein [Helicovermis profundi]|uniref:Uncharacterized protein n=1 Tax=Helicovermis profundi TaxID=3065157 RepID=A0AAU9EF31_9FIRM|nr:hypothetical protein HLPR_03540 [Clostridia bacterium S502]